MLHSRARNATRARHRRAAGRIAPRAGCFPQPRPSPTRLGRARSPLRSPSPLGGARRGRPCRRSSRQRSPVPRGAAVGPAATRPASPPPQQGLGRRRPRGASARPRLAAAQGRPPPRRPGRLSAARFPRAAAPLEGARRGGSARPGSRTALWGRDASPTSHRRRHLGCPPPTTWRPRRRRPA